MKNIAMRSLLLVFFFTLAYIASASAATYYVSPNGTATWAQATNINTPTDGRTAMLNAVAGDIVYFRGGTYTPSNSGVPAWIATSEINRWAIPAWHPSNSGTSNAYITFKAYPGETPSLTSYQYGAPIGVHRRSYIIWDGFTGTSSRVSMQPWIFLGQQTTEDFDTTYCIVRNCYLSGGYTASSAGDNNRHIGVRRARYITIQNNYMANNLCSVNHNSCGVQTYYTENSIFEYNTFYNNNSGMYDKGWSRNNTIRYNFFRNNKIAGITLHETEYDLVYQNVIIDSPNQGIEMESSGGTYSRGHKIYNNTIRNTSGYPLESEAILFEGWNNILINGTSYAFFTSYNNNIYGCPTITYMDYNCYYNGQRFAVKLGCANPSPTTYSSLDAWKSSRQLIGGGNPDTNSIYENPLFVNAGGIIPADYKLQANSPCRNVGRNGVTMGAYITGNEVIGYVGSGISTTTTSIDTTPPAPIDTTPPAVPTNFHIVTTTINN